MQAGGQVKARSNLWHINGFNLLQGISEEEMARVAGLIRMSKHRRGEMIYLPSDVSRNVYFLREGRIKIAGLSEDGHEVLLDIVEPGEIFGVAEAIQHAPRTASALALEDALLGEMDAKDFEALLEAHPQISLRVSRLLAFRLKKVETQLLNLICKDVPTRVREALVDLMDTRSAVGTVTPVRIGLTQQDVANLVGASRQETARALKGLKESGAVELRYRSIVVTAPDKLRSRASIVAH